MCPHGRHTPRGQSGGAHPGRRGHRTPRTTRDHRGPKPYRNNETTHGTAGRGRRILYIGKHTFPP